MLPRFARRAAAQAGAAGTLESDLADIISTQQPGGGGWNNIDLQLDDEDGDLFDDDGASPEEKTACAPASLATLTGSLRKEVQHGGAAELAAASAGAATATPTASNGPHCLGPDGAVICLFNPTGRCRGCNRKAKDLAITLVCFAMIKQLLIAQ